MDKGNKKDWRTRRLANTFRFADNFTALNNGGESGINTDKIRCKVANNLCL